jgi:DNA (cytosine-5)-methyltransferase 1
MKSTMQKSFSPSKGRARTQKPRVIDLFAGVGMFGHGFALEGFRVEHSYEVDPMTAAVNAMNSKAPIDDCDLSKARPKGDCEVLIAGPPCQGFSSIGSKWADDPRNALCMIIPHWAKTTTPKVVVVENVPRFLQSPAWKIMCSQLEALGYEMAVEIVNARHFGVAQNRTRSLTFFSKGKLPDISKQMWAAELNVRDAFAELPKAPSPKIQHYSHTPSKQAAERIALVPYGGDIRDIYRSRPQLVPPSWLKVQDKIVDIWGRLTWEGVSNTIRTGFLHPSRGRFLHPTEDRPITFREAARLQSVCDSFQFSGFGEEIARQIGNGVPTNLARAVARAVREVI